MRHLGGKKGKINMKNKQLIWVGIQGRDETIYEIVRPDRTQTFYFRITPFAEEHERGLDVVVGTLGDEFEKVRIECRDQDGDKDKGTVKIILNELEEHKWVKLLHKEGD